MSTDVTVWFNPDCSKCRTTQGWLADRGIDATYLEYLEAAPSRSDLERAMSLLGTDDPRDVARVADPLWAALDLDDAPRDRIIDALHENPSLIERPIVVVGDRAVIARPPERLLELLDHPSGLAPAVNADEVSARFRAGREQHPSLGATPKSTQ